MIDFCNDFEELVRVLLVSRCHAQVQPVLPRFAFHFALRRSLATVQGKSAALRIATLSAPTVQKSTRAYKRN